MDLGSFSVSLAVTDLGRSQTFYEALGFEVIDGDAAAGWLILSNGEAKLGLFQGMFEHNLLTFNPPDARRIEAAARQAGIEPTRATEGTSGPTHFTIVDPDGNPILFDQH